MREDSCLLKLTPKCPNGKLTNAVIINTFPKKESTFVLKNASSQKSYRRFSISETSQRVKRKNEEVSPEMYFAQLFLEKKN